ncbi:hypothetical protein DWX57_03615 [Coprococcus sp. AF19-8AC]|nr:hypothetical protein DWX57_03615 [Coprococcus sp. AF19-8AC]
MGIRNHIQVSILDVKEKKLGYDRSKTVKVFRSDAPEVVLCYITAETTVCDVPKKQANSTGKGLQITGITVSKPNTPLLSLLSEAGMDKAVIFDWVKRTRLTELRKCVDIAMNVLVDADDDSISESCRVATEFSEKVQSHIPQNGFQFVCNRMIFHTLTLLCEEIGCSNQSDFICNVFYRCF